MSKNDSQKANIKDKNKQFTFKFKNYTNFGNNFEIRKCLIIFVCEKEVCRSITNK